jgi:hypothetical protein
MTSINAIPKTLDGLEVGAKRAEAGARTHGLAVGIKQNTAIEIQFDKEFAFGKPQDPLSPDPNAPIGKRAEYAQARSNAADARFALREALEIGRAFCVQATDILKPQLGRRWNSKWQAAGFTGGSLRQPADPAPRLGLFRAYFRLHPEHENAPLNITAAQADVVLAAIDSKQSMSDTASALEAMAKQERDGAMQKLRRRLSALRYELGLLLEDEDPRWYHFGFNRPIDGRIPAIVEGLVVQTAGPGALRVRWEPSALADNYRVMRSVRNVDPEPVEVGLFADPQTVISNLPSGATVTILVSARNGAGETLPTEAQAVVQ